MKRAAKSFLTHRYTRVNVDFTPKKVDGNIVVDDWGNQEYNSKTTEDLPCLFLWDDVSFTDETGTVIRKVPTLYVFDDDTIGPKDLVQNVQSKNGAVILTSAQVLSVDIATDVGDSIVKVLRLSGAETA